MYKTVYIYGCVPYLPSQSDQCLALSADRLKHYYTRKIWRRTGGGEWSPNNWGKERGDVLCHWKVLCYVILLNCYRENWTWGQWWGRKEHAGWVHGGQWDSMKSLEARLAPRSITPTSIAPIAPTSILFCGPARNPPTPPKYGTRPYIYIYIYIYIYTYIYIVIYV